MKEDIFKKASELAKKIEQYKSFLDEIEFKPETLVENEYYKHLTFKKETEKPLCIYNKTLFNPVIILSYEVLPYNTRKESIFNIDEGTWNEIIDRIKKELENKEVEFENL